MSGELALVLHTHMPYVEGFGTWPFGEEWLWEAIASCYVPVLDVLGPEPAPLTLSLTPVLADQLEAPGALERCARFLCDVRPGTHAEALEHARDPRLGPALAESAAEYARAAEVLEGRGFDLLGAFAPHVSWTSSATHAVLPLLATDAGVRLQVESGVASHRRRFGLGWAGGFWLPECAHGPWLDPLLDAAGVRATCVDLTDVLGPGSAAHLTPLRSAAGPLLLPIDRETIELVWHDRGYPADPAYRNYHGYTKHHHRAWANDGSPYSPERGRARAREHAREFVERAARRVEGGGLVVCALDTELLGHWWHEGPEWLRAVLEEAPRQGVGLARLDDAVAAREAVPAPGELPVTTWGMGRDLSTWSGPGVARYAWEARAAELEVLAGARSVEVGAVRELLALQASDWAFLDNARLAGEYPRERADGHAERLAARLRGEAADLGALRNLAVDAEAGALLLG